jgi:hypothetical protein
MIKKRPTEHIALTTSQWGQLQNRLQKDYNRSIIIPSVLKRDLGFTVRDHKTLKEVDDWTYEKRKVWHHTMCLDFVNESAKSYLILKYNDYLQKITE